MSNDNVNLTVTLQVYFVKYPVVYLLYPVLNPVFADCAGITLLYSQSNKPGSLL